MAPHFPPRHSAFLVLVSIACLAYFSLWLTPIGQAPVVQLEGEHRDATMAAEGGETVHPIVGLMAEGERRWKEVHDRQSSTLEKAVAEYRRRYGLSPPAGFDVWFAWSRNTSVHFVDEYDRLDSSLQLFRGLSPANLREQLRKRKEEFPDPGNRVFEVEVKDGECGGRGRDKWPKVGGARSGEEVCYALRDVVHLMPDIPPGFYSTMDEGQVTLSWTEKERLRLLASTQNRAPPYSLSPPPSHFASDPSLLPHSTETGYVALSLSCPPSSPARTSLTIDAFSSEVHWDDSRDLFSVPREEGGFVRDAGKAMDVCWNTGLRRKQGVLLQWPEVSSIVKGKNHTPVPELRPFFSQSKFSAQSDLLVPQLYGYLRDWEWENVPWDQREDKFIWRGALSGVYYAGSHTIGGYWRDGQRQTLHRLCTAKHGFLDLVWSTSPALGNLLRKGTMRTRAFVEKYLDCGATGTSTCGYDGCETVKSEITFAPHKSDYSHFKFIGDLDGYGWSGRFRSLLLTRSVVVKATAFPEWFSDHLIPWYHYVPMQYDSSDLPNILAFFLGAPPKQGETQREGSHGEMARQIGLNGHAFVEKHWRKEDIASYLWRTMLEYRRLYAEDGADEADFHLP